MILDGTVSASLENKLCLTIYKYRHLYDHLKEEISDMGETYDYRFKVTVVGYDGTDETLQEQLIPEEQKQETQQLEDQIKGLGEEIEYIRKLAQKSDTRGEKKKSRQILGHLVEERNALQAQLNAGGVTETSHAPGVEYYGKTLDVRGSTVKLFLWFISQREWFQKVHHVYAKGSLGALLIYASRNVASLKRISEWCEVFRESCGDIPIRIISVPITGQKNVEGGMFLPELEEMKREIEDKYKIMEFKELSLESPEVVDGLWEDIAHVIGDRFGL